MVSDAATVAAAASRAFLVLARSRTEGSLTDVAVWALAAGEGAQTNPNAIQAAKRGTDRVIFREFTMRFGLFWRDGDEALAACLTTVSFV